MSAKAGIEPWRSGGLGASSRCIASSTCLSPIASSAPQSSSLASPLRRSGPAPHNLSFPDPRRQFSEGRNHGGHESVLEQSRGAEDHALLGARCELGVRGRGFGGHAEAP